MSRIKRLKLTDFRSFSLAEFSFGRTNVIIGRNGVGKTNILEAVRLLSLQKSFRTDKEKEMIRFGAKAARVEGEFVVDNDKLMIETGIEQGKQVKINGAPRSVSSAVGAVKTVLFSSADQAVIEGSPQERRRFLNQLICQRDRLYLTALLGLKRVLRQRNAVLLRISNQEADKTDLAIWDEQLIPLSVSIAQKRAEAIENLNADLPLKYSQIAQNKDNLEIEYQPSRCDAEELNRAFERDVHLGSTTCGPHHDELKILLNQKPLSRYGSRGEFRSAILAIKQAEAEFLTETESPILLLDDLFSELDPNRQRRLRDMIENQQTIITSTALPKAWEKKIKNVIELE